MKLPKKIQDYRVIRDDKHKYYGTTDTQAKTVTINVKKNLKSGGVAELKDTLKHEAMHVKHPSYSESKVNREHKALSREGMGIRGLI